APAVINLFAPRRRASPSRNSSFLSLLPPYGSPVRSSRLTRIRRVPAAVGISWTSSGVGSRASGIQPTISPRSGTRSSSGRDDDCAIARTYMAHRPHVESRRAYRQSRRARAGRHAFGADATFPAMRGQDPGGSWTGARAADHAPGVQEPAGPPGLREALLGGNVLWLGVVSLLNDAASEMIYPLLPLFLVGTLAAAPATLGL